MSTQDWPNFEMVRKQPDGCWLWLGRKNGSGYGTIGAKFAHRMFYEAFKGQIAPGMTIDHLCRVRSCVNPEHMEEVSQRVNVLRGNSPLAANARKTHCINGHELSGANLKVIPATSKRLSRRRCKQCDRQYYRTSDIKRGRYGVA